jgi:hypothetical protein
LLFHPDGNKPQIQHIESSAYNPAVHLGTLQPLFWDHSQMRRNRMRQEREHPLYTLPQYAGCASPVSDAVYTNPPRIMLPVRRNRSCMHWRACAED